MEKKQKPILNHRDKEYMKMAMLKHEETFKHQVYELHRLYQIQKMLMRDAAKIARNNNWRACSRAEARLCLDLERPDQGGDMSRVSETEDDDDDDKSDLELTLGPRSYYLEKIKAAEAASEPDSGPSFPSWSGHTKGIMRRGAFKRDDFSGQLKLCGPEMPVSNTINQDRLNNSPWLIRALSLNIT